MGDSAGDGDEYGDGSPRVGMEEQKDSDLGSFAHQPRFRFRLQNISLKWASQVVKENGISLTKYHCRILLFLLSLDKMRWKIDLSELIISALLAIGTGQKLIDSRKVEYSLINYGYFFVLKMNCAKDT